MSTHFTYEIDERKLRVKLKDLEVPFDSDALQRFEAYHNAQSRHHAGSRLGNVQLPLNRNVIVPLVFGLLIVFFSFLLFNFINIKNPIKETGNAPATEVIIPKAEVKPAGNPLTPVNAAQNPPAGPQNTEGIKQAETIVQPDKKPEPDKNKLPAGVMPAVASATPGQIDRQATTKQPAETNKTSASPAVSAGPTQTLAQTSAATVTTQSADPLAKKKRKRRSADVVETDSSGDSRPSPGGEERETETRPN